MMDHAPLTDQLPAGFEHEIVNLKEIGDGFSALIRSSCVTGIDAQKWVDDYGKNTGYRWYVKRTYPNFKRILFRQDWVCEHSAFVKGRRKKGISEQSDNCDARISIKIQHNTRNTRRNEFVRKGLRTEIRLHAAHNCTRTRTAAYGTQGAKTEVDGYGQEYLDGHFVDDQGAVAMPEDDPPVLQKRPAMVFTRGNEMKNLRSKTTVRQGESKGQNFQVVLRKKPPPPPPTSAAGEEFDDQRSPSPTAPRKRTIASSSTVPKKKLRQERSTSKTRSSDDDDVRSEAVSESTNSDLGDASKVFFARPLDKSGIRYDIDGYDFRRDTTLKNNSLGLRCQRNTARTPEQCHMRATIYLRNYDGKKKSAIMTKYRELPPGDNRVVAILSSQSDRHNHSRPLPGFDNESRPKSSEPKKKKKTVTRQREKTEKEGGKKEDESGDDDDEEESGQEEEKEGDDEESGNEEHQEEEGKCEETEGTSKQIDRPKKKPKKKRPTRFAQIRVTRSGRGRRQTKERAAHAWAWLKKGAERPNMDDAAPTLTKMMKKKMIPGSNTTRTSGVSPSKTTPLRPIPLGSATKVPRLPGVQLPSKKPVAPVRPTMVPMMSTSRPSGIAATSSGGPIKKGSVLGLLKQNAFLRYHAQKQQRPAVGGTATAPKRPRLDLDASSDRSTPSSMDDGTTLDQATYVHKVTIYDDKFYIMDGFAYEKERDRKNGLGFFLRCVDRLNCKARAMTMWKSENGSQTKILYGRHGAGPPHSHDRSAPGHGVDTDDQAMAISRLELAMTTAKLDMESGEEDEGETMERSNEGMQEDVAGPSMGAVGERKRKKSLLPCKVDVRLMQSRYHHVFRTLVELQDGTKVDSYPALYRLVEAPGEQLIEFLTDEDMNDGSDLQQEFGIDHTTTWVLNEQLKQYRAFYDLCALSLEEFTRFIDSYEKWLTPESAEMWWNNGDMMELLSRRILRSEKLRDAYESALIRSQGSSRLRILDRPILPLPMPGFLHCQSSSIQCEEMRESLCGLKALSELYEGGTENPTVQGLMADFDEAADGFLEYLEQREDDAPAGSDTQSNTRQRLKKVTSDTSQETNGNGKSALIPGIKLPVSSGLNGKATKNGNANGKSKANEAAKKAYQEQYGWKPSKNGLRQIYFKYNYVLTRLCKLQKEANTEITAEDIVKNQIDNEKSPQFDLKCRDCYQSLKNFRAVCDFLALAPAHAVNIVTWFQKWRTPSKTEDTWKTGFVFEYICRLILRSFRYKALYKKAIDDSLTSTNVAASSRPPLLPFGKPKFIGCPKSIRQHRRMRSLALSRFIVHMKYMGQTESRVQGVLQEMEKAANEFFEYLRKNDAWPVKPSLLLFLASENNATTKTDSDSQDDLFERLQQELSILDTHCIKKTPAPAAEKTEATSKAVKGRPKRAEKSSGKTTKTRNGKKPTIANAQGRAQRSQAVPMSPTRFLHKMEAKLEEVDKTFAEVNAIRAFADPAPEFVMSIGRTAFIKSNNSDTKKSGSQKWGKDLNAHDRRIAQIIDDYSHFEAVLTLDDLAKAVESCQFEHPALGLIMIRRGLVIRCGQNIGEAAVESGSRRVTLGVQQLPKCVPLSKIDFDETKRTLLLNGIAVELRTKDKCR